MSIARVTPAVSVQAVSKRFRYWMDRPTSIKTALVELLKGRFTTGRAQTFDCLRNVSFEIFPGEFVGIMGRNGSGKSTLMKLIAGIYTPTSGRIEVRDRVAPLIELGAGFNYELSGLENISLNAAILGFGRRQTMQALDSIIEFSELGDKIHMPVKNYSSGMLVRLGFSIATHLDAPILLVDEVLAVGDVQFQQKCLAKIRELHRLQGRTIILITHDPRAVQEHCTRAILIGGGGVLAEGAPQDIANRYLDI